jgi:hypothetical protein
MIPPGIEAPVLKKLFEFTIREQKKIEWDIETNFAMELRDLLIANEKVTDVEEDILPIDRSEKKQVMDLLMKNSLGNFGAALKSFIASGYTDKILGIGKGLENDADGILGSVRREMESGAVYRYFLHSIVSQKLRL